MPTLAEWIQQYYWQKWFAPQPKRLRPRKVVYGPRLSGTVRSADDGGNSEGEELSGAVDTHGTPGRSAEAPVRQRSTGEVQRSSSGEPDPPNPPQAMKVTHRYTGPNMPGRKFGIAQGDVGHITGSKRGGLVSFVRDDGKAFWIVPRHLEDIR